MFFTKVKSVNVNELKNLLDQGIKITILDVREKDEFRNGHIKGAQNLPLSVISNVKFKEKHAYVICQSGMRSKRACQYLTKQGYDVTNVSGGMSAWEGDVV